MTTDGTSNSVISMDVPRVMGLQQIDFIREYLTPGFPVIVTKEMAGWNAPNTWTPAFLRQRFGDFLVPVYNDLFDIVDVMTLAEYLDAEFHDGADSSCRYVRWYSRFHAGDFIWADDVFIQLKDDWAMPSFLPRDAYVIPFVEGATLDVTQHAFPYRGLFISGPNASTRLHCDPWASAAVLCQVRGEKQFSLFDPSGESRNDGASRMRYDGILSAGEIIFIPDGWNHSFITLTPSISVTWNFVHAERRHAYDSHLARYPDDPNLDIARFFSARA